MKLPALQSSIFLGLLVVLAACSSFQTEPVSRQSTFVKQSLPQGYQGRRDLYVADYGLGEIFAFKNDGYTSDGTITTGINGPQGVTLDDSGNLFVANRGGGNVAQYAPGASTPSFVYSAGISSPLFVSVDRKGNVFAADVPEPNGPDAVVQYHTGVDRLVNRCVVPGIFSVAADSYGNVFVAYNVTVNGPARVVEYKGGLAGCSATVLGAQVAYAGGMALDKQNDIIITDGNRPRVDVIPPPYSAISRILKFRGVTPVFVSIDRPNRKLFVTVAGFYSSYVYVVDYASGSVLHVLGSRYGLAIPYGAVDGPNDVQ